MAVLLFASYIIKPGFGGISIIYYIRHEDKILCSVYSVDLLIRNGTDGLQASCHKANVNVGHTKMTNAVKASKI